MASSKSQRPKRSCVPGIIEQEQQLLADVKRTIASAPRSRNISGYDGQLTRLRDELIEQKLPDDRARILEQMDRLSKISAARSRYAPEQVDPASPYFGHLAFVTLEGQEREILLGKQSFITEGVRIVDWRNAPISSIFYRYTEGDEFIEEIAGSRLAGRVTKRRAVTIVGGELLRVASPQRVYMKSSEGWRDISYRSAKLEGGAGSALRPDTATPLLGADDGTEREHEPDKHLPEIAALLDSRQFDLLTRDGESLLVVTGGAGSGKTTVGLHRVAYLGFADPERFRPRRMLALVFGSALARYISRVLPALGMGDVPVRTLRSWAVGQQHKHFPELTRRLCPYTPASVVRFKTNRVLVPMLEEAAAAAPGSEPAELFDDLFTDRGWIRTGISRHAPGSFTDEQIEEIHRWCTDQQFKRFDGGGRADDEPPCYDEEDAMILLRLYQLIEGRLRWSKRRKLSYDHLMIDEAQDFSPLELLVLLQTVRGESVTLAGDPAQRITDNDFTSWSELLRVIGLERYHVSPLKVSYRSTKPIMELARAVLGPLAPVEPLQVPRDGEPVELLRFGDKGAAMTFLGDALCDLQRREPAASVAVMTQTGKQARQAYQALRRTELENLNLVSDQDFCFGPGVEVTDVAQTKGLEFDYVVVLNADEEEYPATSSARHLLHVGITRAIHQLWLVAWKRSSPLFPDWLSPRLEG